MALEMARGARKAACGRVRFGSCGTFPGGGGVDVGASRVITSNRKWSEIGLGRECVMIIIFWFASRGGSFPVLNIEEG